MTQSYQTKAELMRASSVKNRRAREVEEAKVFEARTANLIALHATMDGYGSTAALERKTNLMKLIKGRLGLTRDCLPKE